MPKKWFPSATHKIAGRCHHGVRISLSFMDGYLGYNQIQMAPEDEEATTFSTPIKIFCYRVMPFSLKNASATYQRAMTYIFEDLLHDAIECYVDDLVVKTKLRQHHIIDLDRVFQQLHHYNLKMNHLKCAFGVSLGQFLGFIVRHNGIEIYPKKIMAIIKMPTPRNISELKKL